MEHENDDAELWTTSAISAQQVTGKCDGECPGMSKTIVDGLS
jgi:hypothetical protein